MVDINIKHLHYHEADMSAPHLTDETRRRIAALEELRYKIPETGAHCVSSCMDGDCERPRHPDYIVENGLVFYRPRELRPE